MYYDRTVSPALIDALPPHGPFASIADLARSRHLADLQLRGYPNKKRCGLTKVLDVAERDGQFALTGTAAAAEWSQRQQPLARLRPHRPGTIDQLLKEIDNDPTGIFWD